MTDGFWRIKQFSPVAPSGITVTDIPVRGNADGLTEPVWWTEPALQFRWNNGREEYFPWASIVHAEYQPPTAPDLTIPDEDW